MTSTPNRKRGGLDGLDSRAVVERVDELLEARYRSADLGNLDDVLAVLLHPFAETAGLVGTGPFNLGGPDDYRVPDRGYHRGRPAGTWVPPRSRGKWTSPRSWRPWPGFRCCEATYLPRTGASLNP